MPVNRMMNFDEPVMSLAVVSGSAGPIGNLVNAAQPEVAVQGPVNAPAPRGMA